MSDTSSQHPPPDDTVVPGHDSAVLPEAEDFLELAADEPPDVLDEVTVDDDATAESGGLPDLPPAELDKVYGLPIPEVELLLKAQQEAQARAYKIVRHLRAAQDKISEIRQEKKELVAELRSSQQTNERLRNELEALKQQYENAVKSATSVQALLRQHEGKIAEQTLQIGKLNELIETSRKKLLDLQQCREELNAAKKAAAEHELELQMLRENCSQASQRNELLQAQLDEARTEREELIKLMRAAMARLEKHRGTGTS